MTGPYLLAALALGAPLPAAAAHDVDVTSVARVFLDQVGERRYLLTVVDTKVPPIIGTSDVLPAGCAPVQVEGLARTLPGLWFECPEPLTFDDTLVLPWRLAGVVVVAGWLDGTTASAYFRGDGRAVRIHLEDLRAGASSSGRLAGRYFVLGVEHILFGLDHLLFVLGLLLLVQGAWPLIKTVTAFTVAHSITLGAAVLGYVPVASAPVEAAIALSIVLLAREILAGHRGRVHLVHRRPWLVALTFGLLHGLGFAGALGEIGLRTADIPAALLFFNVGVEAGQLGFIALVVAANRALGRAVERIVPTFQPALGYALGVLATLWLFERLPAVWGS